MTSYANEKDWLRAEYESFGSAIKDLKELDSYYVENFKRCLIYDDEKVREALARGIDYIKRERKKLAAKIDKIEVSASL